MSVVAYNVGTSLLGAFWKHVAGPLLRLVWSMVSAPVRLPVRFVRRRIVQPMQRRAQRRRMEEAERERRRKELADQLDAERRERERLAELERILKPE